MRNDRVFLLNQESEIFRTEEGEGHNFVYLYTPALDEATTARAQELIWQKLAEI
jgi:hypothetical protein